MNDTPNQAGLVVEKPVQINASSGDTKAEQPAVHPFNLTAESLPPNAEPGMEAVQQNPTEAAQAGDQPADAEKKTETAEAPVAAESPAPVEPAAEQKPVEEEKPVEVEHLADEAADDGADPLLQAMVKDTDQKEEEDPEYDLDINQLLLGPRGDALYELLAKHYPTNESVKKARKDPKSFLSKCLAAAENGWGSVSKDDFDDILSRHDTYKALKSQHDIQGFADGRPRNWRTTNPELNGEEAILAVEARLGKIVRLNLMNSGFWIAIRSPELGELQELFSNIDLEGREIGRIMGSHFALITDMYLKRKLIEMLVTYKFIRKSNFVDAKDPAAFMKNLAYHDYDTILHGLVTLMSREGFRMQMVCPKCKHIGTEENIDISACKYLNMNLMTKEVRDYWAQTIDDHGNLIVRTEEDLKRYREQILNFKHTIVQEVSTGYEKVTVELDMIEPTMFRYFSIGELLIQKLNQTINSIANGDEAKANLVKSSLTIHGFQLMAPWIKELRIKNADGHLDIVTTTPGAIIKQLDSMLQDDKVSMFQELHEFISTSRFNYFGSFALECPACGLKADAEKLGGFYPLEMATIFFGLFFRRLRVGR